MRELAPYLFIVLGPTLVVAITIWVCNFMDGK